jgi:hypothetical protein
MHDGVRKRGFGDHLCHGRHEGQLPWDFTRQVMSGAGLPNLCGVIPIPKT